MIIKKLTLFCLVILLSCSERSPIQQYYFGVGNGEFIVIAPSCEIVLSEINGRKNTYINSVWDQKLIDDNYIRLRGSIIYNGNYDTERLGVNLIIGDDEIEFLNDRYTRISDPLICDSLKRNMWRISDCNH